ncbi:MAG: adenylate kinase [Thermoleophilia bacterium]|nr:adenylate kinase [Thermoleophilia bacterium]
MRRVLVSGISGAGKTTLARRVAAALDLPYTELDALHHGPGWIKRPEFEADTAALAASDRWITEDQYQSFIGDLLWQRADTLLWLDLPRRVVMWRVVTRTFVRMVLRTPLYNGNRERVRNLLSSGHPIRWAWTHHADRRARTQEQVAAHPDVVVVRFRSTADVAAWCGRLGARAEVSSPEP